jgi:enoyl-CoA hydratase/carnithine racemase
MTEKLIRTDKDYIAYLKLNDNPANSLSSEMMGAIQAELTEIDTNPTIRVVVFESASEKIFCSGHSLTEVKGMMSDKDVQAQEKLFAQCSMMMKQIQQISKPAIAKVRGVATAAGNQLVASCDLAYGSEDSRYALPGANIGLFCHTPQVAVSRTVGRKATMEMLLSGQMINSAKAEKIGLINKVVSSADLDSEVEMICATINQKSAEVIAQGKRSFYRQIEMGLTDAYAATSQNMVKNLELNDANEGISSFLEKRQPEWTND